MERLIGALVEYLAAQTELAKAHAANVNGGGGRMSQSQKLGFESEPASKPKRGRKAKKKEEAPTEPKKEEVSVDPLAGLAGEEKQKTDDEVKKEMEDVARVMAGHFKNKEPNGIVRIRDYFKKTFKVKVLSEIKKREDREKITAWMKEQVESA